MTNFLPSTRRFVRYGTVLFIGLIGCDPASQPDASDPVACRIQRIDSESVTSSNTLRSQTVYTYDAQQNVSRVTYTYTSKSVGNPVDIVYSGVTEYTYDADGYLTGSTLRATEQRANSQGQPVNAEWSSATNYAYASGRVASYTTVSVGQGGGRSTIQGTYAYTGNEQFTKTETTGGFVRVYTYDKGLLTDYVERNGTTETRPWAINDGLVMRQAIEGGWVGTYQYDNNRQRTRFEEAVNGKQTQYTLTVNDPVAKPADAARPALKGQPVVRSAFGQAGLFTNEKLYVLNPVSGQFQFVVEKQATNQTNGAGFVTSRTVTSRNPGAPDLAPTTTTETYTYANCP